MEKKSLIRSRVFYYYVILSCLFVVFVNGHGLAQNLSLSDFVIYANADTGSQNPNKNILNSKGVEIHDNTQILSGNIGSNYFIRTTGPVNINGDLHSADYIDLAWNNVVKGNITSAGNNNFDQNAFKADLGFSLQGNLDINGNIIIRRNSTVNGTVTHPSGTSYTGPSPSGGEVTGTPSIPVLPPNPKITQFNPAGTQNITESQTITPGSYGAIKLNNNSTIVLSGPGVYTFKSILALGDLTKFVFDFNNSPDGVFILQIYGDVNLGRFRSSLINGGSASRIYAETHGDGKAYGYGTYAWVMDNCITGNSEWLGTVYAPFGGINIGSLTGSSIIEGALWSRAGIKINYGVKVKLASFQSCIPPNADAGDDRVISCTNSSTVILHGSSSTPGVKYNWQAIDSGFIVSRADTATPVVSKAGNYVLTVTTTSGCKATDTVFVKSSCIVPYYPPPDNGKTHDIIGSELNALFDNFGTVQDTAQNIFTLFNDSVLIEIISKQGKYDELLSKLQTPEYGLTDIIYNGANSLIITGKYPVINLLKLDSLQDLINFCRPAFPPVSNSGVVNSAGDTAMYSNFARNGFNLSGQGIKVGVLSNGYNTIPGNPALTDVLNGDLPGTRNPDNNTPVDVLRDYPYGRTTD